MAEEVRWKEQQNEVFRHKSFENESAEESDMEIDRGHSPCSTPRVPAIVQPRPLASSRNLR